MLYEDGAEIPYQVAVSRGGNGLVHGEAGHMVDPALMREGDLEPVNDCSTINPISGINDGAL